MAKDRPFKVHKVLQRLVDGAPLDDVARELRTDVDVVEAIATEWGYPVRSRLEVAVEEIEAAHRRGSPYPEVDVPLAADYAAAVPAAAPPAAAAAPEPAPAPPEPAAAADQPAQPPAAATIACADCDRKFETSAALGGHRKVHGQPTPTVPLACPDCDEPFSTYAALVNHRKTHTEPPTSPPPAATPLPAPAAVVQPDGDATRVEPLPTPDPAIDGLLNQLQDVLDDHHANGSEAVRAVVQKLTTTLDEVQILASSLARALAVDAAADAIRAQVASLDAEVERIRAERARLIDELAGQIPAQLSPEQTRRCKAWAVANDLLRSDRAHLTNTATAAWWLAGCPDLQETAS